MRKSFAESVIAMHSQTESFFLTGDLGFMALEEVRQAFGERFINMGVAEQNMVSVAAGLAKEGHPTFVYSIAPFCYARPFEQIRNDVCFSHLPVCLVGNGGGYAYGHMGPSHHALEDCAAMCSLAGMKVYAPAFDEDVHCILKSIADRSGPAYLRLGYDVKPKTENLSSEYAPFRLILEGDCGVMLALGPMAGVCWSALMDISTAKRPALYAVTELPITNMPLDVLERLGENAPLFIVEEHLQAGGLGMQSVYFLATQKIIVVNLYHRYALGYPSGTYGSQNFHRVECGLDVDAIKEFVLNKA